MDIEQIAVRRTSLDEVMRTSFDTFWSANSQENFLDMDPGTFGSTTENGYYEAVASIVSKGGIHLAIGGGLDPALTQLAITNPDITLICDSNIFAQRIISRRLQLIDSSVDGQHYWELATEAIGNDVVWMFPSDYLKGGWSSPELYTLVKSAWKRGAIKLMGYDIITDGLRAALRLAYENGIPLRLIYLSNIFDYKKENGCRLDFFKMQLKEAVGKNLIDPKGNIIETSVEYNQKNKATPIEEYLSI